MLEAQNLFIRNVSASPFVAVEASSTIAPGDTLNLNAAGYATLDDALRACEGGTTIAIGIRDGKLQPHVGPVPNA